MKSSLVAPRISRNQARFYGMVQAALCAEDDNKAILLSSQAALYAANYPCGILASPDLEQRLCHIAKAHKVPLVQQGQRETGSVLHIMTRAYETGGHTRVCERWIEAESDKRHSVILLNQGDFPLPDTLIQKVKASGGKIEELPAAAPLQMALSLRQISSRYTRIILNTHMHDALPLVAFGTPEFEVPVFYFNHADHLFWLGGMIADEVINFRTMAAKNNPIWRGIDRNSILPLPTGDISGHQKDSQRAAITRRELGIPQQAKVLITIASAYKYTPFAGLDFVKTAASILAANPQSYLLVIGPSQGDRTWSALSQSFPDRVKMLGMVPHQQLDDYLEVADVALESFPLGSPTALIDAVRFGIPCVSLKTPPNTYDAFLESGIICATPDDYITRALTYLDNPPPHNQLKEILERESSPAGYAERITSCVEKAAKTHQVYKMQIDPHRPISDFEFFVAHQSFVAERSGFGIFKSLVRRIVYLGVRACPTSALVKWVYPALAKRLLA